MSEFIITTDSTADLSDEYVKKENLLIQPLYYSIDDIVYGNDQVMEPKEFYAAMRNGKMPNTMAINPELMIETLKPHLMAGKDVLHIAFSSGLSSAYQNAVIAANELSEEFPERTIRVFDSKAASLGEGLMVHKALKMRREGSSLAEIYQWLTDNLEHFCHQFTVDDLNHLYRGGRISKTTAVIGSVVNLKPILHVDSEGKLTSLGIARGRKKALAKIVEHMADAIKGYEDQNEEVFISHADCEADALHVAALVQAQFGLPCTLLNYVGPTIGAHAGPGTVALFFIGDKR